MRSLCFKKVELFLVEIYFSSLNLTNLYFDGVKVSLFGHQNGINAQLTCCKHSNVGSELSVDNKSLIFCVLEYGLIYRDRIFAESIGAFEVSFVPVWKGVVRV